MKYGYIYSVVGCGWKNNEEHTCNTYGLVFEVSENAAKGHAIDKFENSHPGIPILTVGITPINAQPDSVRLNYGSLVKLDKGEM